MRAGQIQPAGFVFGIEPDQEFEAEHRVAVFSLGNIAPRQRIVILDDIGFLVPARLHAEEPAHKIVTGIDQYFFIKHGFSSP